jgi:hypothetical protein
MENNEDRMGGNACHEHLAGGWSKSVECSRQSISTRVQRQAAQPTQMMHLEEHILPRPVMQLLRDLFQGTLRFRFYHFENKIPDGCLLRHKAIPRSDKNLGAAD